MKKVYSFLGILIVLALAAAIPAFATSPTKENNAAPAVNATTSVDVTSTQGQTQSSTSANILDLDEVSIGLGLGAGSAHYTGDCVVPKKGRNGKTGFLERGWTLILLRVDPAVEVDEACIARAHELEMERLELERERLAIERLMLELRLEEFGAK